MSGRTLEVISASGLITVQDGGRRGQMHSGIPAGGPLVAELLARANGVVGNAPTEAALEVVGQLTVRAAGEGLVAGLEDGTLFPLSPGVELTVRPSPESRVRYLALRGGVDVPLVLGGRGTLLVGAFGGFQGRVLRRGDLLPVANRSLSEARARTYPPLDLAAPIRVRPGPDLSRFEEDALEVLLGGTFTVLPTSDRTGTRLQGPILRRRDGDQAASAPMVPGAMQVPAAGAPIVLGPDHPTIGGYPLLGVVLCEELGRFAAHSIGATVRFQAD